MLRREGERENLNRHFGHELVQETESEREREREGRGVARGGGGWGGVGWGLAGINERVLNDVTGWERGGSMINRRFLGH